jgi:hypothetical protein
MTLEGLGIVVALVVSLAGIVLAVLKSKPEMLRLDAETSEIFQEMLAKEVQKGIAKDTTIIAMKIRIDFLEAELKQMCEERDDLKDWANRLVKQVVAANKTPVKMRRRVA